MNFLPFMHRYFHVMFGLVEVSGCGIEFPDRGACQREMLDMIIAGTTATLLDILYVFVISFVVYCGFCVSGADVAQEVLVTLQKPWPKMIVRFGLGIAFLYSAWYAGREGMYRVMCSNIMVALLLLNMWKLGRRCEQYLLRVESMAHKTLLRWQDSRRFPSWPEDL